jgi:protein-L-isoaspartate(D-aspartate) O-methyltransferase
MRDYLTPRTNMVDSQLRPNRVLDPALLDAFQTVPREAFVPERLQGLAYSDEALPLGGGRYMLEPLVLARLLQEAGITPDDTVLDIACGMGYAAALLGRLARTVTALELDEGLARSARAALRTAGAQNVSVVEAGFGQGYPQRGPYDVILIEGTVGAVPSALLDQLASGGRLLGILRPPTDAGAPTGAELVLLGQAVVMTRHETGIATRVLFETGMHDLPGLADAPAFVF